MNETWLTVVPQSAFQAVTQLHPLLGQTSPDTPATTESSPVPSGIAGFFAGLGISNIGELLVNLLGALAILVLGWIIAAIVASVVRNLLKRTDIDNRLASWTTGRQGQAAPNVEKIFSNIVFWIIMILAVVAALNVLNLTTVSQPLNNFLNQIFAFLPRLGSAAILIGIAWVLATLTKAIVVRTARTFGLDEKLSQQTDSTPPPGTPPPTSATTPPPTSTDNQFLLSETLGNALYWFIFLFFLPLILDVLGLQGPLQPVQNLLNDILTALPNILKAVIIAAVGWLLAKVVRGIVTNLLSATGADRLGQQFGLGRGGRGQSLSWLIGTIVYILILIPTAVAALQALQIEAISAPAVNMLDQILAALPKIFTASLILIAAYVIGKFIADLVSSFLSGLGFDNLFYWLGLQATPTPPTPPPAPPIDGQPTVIQEPTTPTPRTPSEIVGIIVLVGIMLFAAVPAADALGLPALTAVVSGLLAISGQVLVGLAIFAVGLYLANFVFNLISSSGSPQARILAQTARIAIIALVSAMALQQAGIATNIVNLAFGLLLGAIAVAIALAFGLGGRDVAAEQLREWLTTFRQNRPPY
jgi:hypothetical protein